MEKRGETIATNLAAVSTKSLLTYNFVTLEQDAEQTAQARDVLYTIILDRDGRVAAYSGQSEKQGLILPDPVSQQAVQARTTLIQRVPQTRQDSGALRHCCASVRARQPREMGHSARGIVPA